MLRETRQDEVTPPYADASSEERAKAQNKKLKVIIKDYFMEKHNIDIEDKMFEWRTKYRVYMDKLTPMT